MLYFLLPEFIFLPLQNDGFIPGNFSISYPFRKFFRLLVQEEIKPGQRDKIFYETAPFLFAAAVLGAFSVLPLLENTVIVNMATGGLFLNAALAYIMVSMLMAGWSANGVYSMIGGWRFLAQLIAYSMPVVMTITAAVMRAESISLIKIVESQQGLWNIIYQPVGFVLFYLSAMALSFLPPFDLPVSKGELAGGVWSEFTGVRLLVFKIKPADAYPHTFGFNSGFVSWWMVGTVAARIHGCF